MTEHDRTEKFQRFAELSHHITATFRVHMSADWPEHELSMPQFKTLMFLSAGSQRMGDLARMLGISLSSVTNLVSRLEGKGLVQRDHDLEDRRVVTCELTDEGRRTVTRFWTVGEKEVETILGQLGDDELDLVLHAFELLARAGERAGVTARDIDHPSSSH